MKHKSSTEKAQILAKHKRGGLSLQQFAAQQGIAFSTLQRWANKARVAAADKSRAKLVEVPNLFACATAGAFYRLHFPRGLVLEVAPDFRVDELRSLVQVIHNL